MMSLKTAPAIVATFLWIGFVSAISFMEAWLKFQAPGITIPLGLGIGRLVFNALNKVEFVLAFIIIIQLVLSKSYGINRQSIWFLIPFVLLISQTFWLLPALDVRADMHIQQQHVPPSNLHIYYVAMEVVKVFCLSLFGLLFFTQKTTK